jgi:hypothetical protein
MADFSPDDLREVQSLTISIGKAMDALSDKSDKRNKKIQQELNTLKSITSELESEESIQKALENLERRKGVILKSNYGVNQKLKQELVDQNVFATKALNLELKRVQITRKVAEAAQSVGDSMSSSIDNIKSEIQQIPLIGNVLGGLFPAEKLKKSVGDMTSGFTRGFGTMFKRNLSQGKGFVQSFSGGMKAGFGQLSKSLGPLLANPYALAALAAASFIAIGVLAFYKVTKAAQEFREETGLLNSQTQGLETQINNVYMKTSLLGASMSDVAKAAADFTNEFHGIEMPSDAVLTSMVALNKNFGIATGDAAKLNKVFQEMSGLTAEQAQHLVSSTVQMAEMAGVAPSRVIKDLAENSADISVYFRGSAEELSKAAIQAAALGTSMGDLTKQADSLLNFESSIASEMKASALFGTHINMNKARAAAFDGDMLGMNKAMIQEVSKLGKLSDLDFAKKKALTELTGKDIGELERQVKLYSKFPNLREEELAAAEALLDTGKDISELTQDDLDAKNQEIIKNQQMQNQFDAMKNEASAIFDELMQSLMPIGSAVIGILIPIFSIIKGLFRPISAAISNVMTAVGKLFAPFKEIFGEGSGEGLKSVMEAIGALITGPLMFGTNLLAGIIDSIANVFGGIVKVIKGIFTGDLAMIGEGILSIFEGIVGYVLRIPIALYDTIVGIFPSIGEFFSSLTSQIQSFFMGMLPTWAQNLLGGGDVTQQQAEAAELEAAGSIEDGIVQNGKIVTTDPADTLIATKTPGDLLGSLLENSPIGMLGSALGGLVGGGGGGDMTALLDEIRGLRADLNSGKIAVYMDGKNVTTKVASIASKSTKNNYK